MNNKFDLRYAELVNEILTVGNARGSARADMPPTVGIFASRVVVENVYKSFPLLTTKEMSVRNVLVELVWFLRGDTNIKYLVENKCNIWNDDAYKYYKRLCKGNDVEPEEQGEWLLKVKNGEKHSSILLENRLKYHYGDLGAVYGKQWVSFGEGVNQILSCVDKIMYDPMDRYKIVSAWNPNDLGKCALPPCHILFQFYCEGEFLDLQFYMRSIDVGLGLPYNIASYSALLLAVASLTGYKPRNVIFIGGDTHIYENHIELLSDQVTRDPFSSPILKFNKPDGLLTSKQIVDFLTKDLTADHFVLEGYEAHPAVKLKLSVGV